MIERLVLFGATGDLAGRFLLPALAALHAAGKLPESFHVLGAAREELDDTAFRRSAAERLEEHAADVPAASREAVVRVLRYRPVDIGNARSVAALFEDGSPPAAAYLALPPSVFPAAVGALAGAGLPAGSRIALEKPFGVDLESAVALNGLLASAVRDGERGVFRVDHVLGMATVQNLVAMRLANPMLESVWNGHHVDRVEILWEETLALKGRAGYYDTAGALEDVMQNHMLQILALVAMEAPATPGERDLRDLKVEALRAIRPLHHADVRSRTRRARYTAGPLAGSPEGGGRVVPAYAEEDGVEPGRKTETFAEVVLELESERWHGTPFVLRAGKALGRRRKMVVLHFAGGAAGRPGSELRIGIDGPEEITLHLNGGARGSFTPLALTGRPPAGDVPAYGRVLLDILSGGSSLSVRGDEAEQAWRVVAPVLGGWSEDVVPLEEYSAGSDGPPPPGASSSACDGAGRD